MTPTAKTGNPSQANRGGNTRVIRDRVTLDIDSLRQRRRRVVRRLEQWLEADRERIYDLAERMVKFGLYAKSTCASDKVSGILSTLAKINGYETPPLRNRWLLKTGWIEFWGYSGTKNKRLMRLLRAGGAA